MAEITVKAAYGSVVEDEGSLFIGFAAGEDADEGYVLFRQDLGGGPIWFEASDETFGAEDAIEAGFGQRKWHYSDLLLANLQLVCECNGCPQFITQARELTKVALKA